MTDIASTFVGDMADRERSAVVHHYVIDLQVQGRVAAYRRRLEDDALRAAGLNRNDGRQTSSGTLMMSVDGNPSGTVATGAAPKPRRKSVWRAHAAAQPSSPRAVPRFTFGSELWWLSTPW